MTENNIQNIKPIILSFFPGSKILLFGSRARKEDNQNSDYDLLIITKSTIPLTEKASLGSKVNKILVNTIKQPVDLIINSEYEISIKKTLPGHVVQWALKEGIWL